MKVRVLMWAEIDLGEQNNMYNLQELAAAKLDEFREAVLPSENYGICLYQAELVEHVEEEP